MSCRAPLAFVLLAGVLVTPGPVRSDEDEPKDIGLRERTSRRIAQIDVTVSGPDDVIRDLDEDDFELKVHGRFISEFTVDNVCHPVSAEGKPEKATKEEETGDEPPAPTRFVLPISYLFYFDQWHLTGGGRANALDTARKMIPKLIANGNRGMVASAGKELRIYGDFTDDPEPLLTSLDEIEKDRMQWVDFSTLEDQRIRDVLYWMDNEPSRALSLARLYQKEERWGTERALHRFSMVLARMADVDQPKATVYFADTMRQNAGAHYLSFFGTSSTGRELSGAAAGAAGTTMLGSMELDAFTAGNPFNRVLEEAAAHGIRMYTIQAEGLVAPHDPGGSGTPGAFASGDGNRQRVRDAEGSLVSLAVETGGQHFLRGVAPGRITRAVQEDLACLYLVSFDADELPEDKILRIVLDVKRPKVKVQVRGQMVLQSEGRRNTSRLLAAFASEDDGKAQTGQIQTTILPLGWKEGAYTALVQFSVPPSPLPGATWELGASLVSRAKVRDDASGRVEIPRAWVPVIFETEMSFSPGPYELVTVAHEQVEDQILSARWDGDWPDPDESPITLAPFAVIQPRVGIFLRDGESRPRGSFALGENARVAVDLPTALMGIVCRSKSRKKPIRVERRLIGESPVDFPEIEVEFGDERCAQIVDRIPGNTMTEGSFTYEVVVRDGKEEEMATTSLDFFAVTGEPSAPEPGPDVTSTRPPEERP